MARTFFTGGTMPSHDLLLHFQRDLKLEKRWTVNGKHYAKTCDAWLAKLDGAYHQIWPILQATYGNFARDDGRNIANFIHATFQVLRMLHVGTSIGVCSSSSAPRRSGTTTATNGWSRTTVLKNREFIALGYKYTGILLSVLLNLGCLNLENGCSGTGTG